MSLRQIKPTDALTLFNECLGLGTNRNSANVGAVVTPIDLNSMVGAVCICRDTAPDHRAQTIFNLLKKNLRQCIKALGPVFFLSQLDQRTEYLPVATFARVGNREVFRHQRFDDRRGIAAGLGTGTEAKLPSNMTDC